MRSLGISGIGITRRNWSPGRLFAAGEQGVWLDPSDLSTLFQDAAGTTQVTAVGQQVGLMRDKSGQGNHASQSSAGSRPTLQQDSGGRLYLAFDGVDDFMVCGSVNLSASDKLFVVAGQRKNSDATLGMLAELSVSSGASSGTMFLAAPRTAGSGDYGVRSRGTASAEATSAATFGAPHTAVLTMTADIAGDALALRVNGAAAGSSAVDQGTGNYGINPLYIGMRAGANLPFSGRLYGFILRSGSSVQPQTVQTAEAWMNRKTGAY